MPDPESTRWTLIRAAAEGDGAARDAFARLYQPVIRAYLRTRWRYSRRLDGIEDAVQDVFVECFKETGALGRANEDAAGGFRAFLFGVTRNVARRIEEKGARRREIQPESAGDLGRVPDGEEPLSRAFDRAWTRSMLREARRVQAERAEAKGAAARRRVELLRMRFVEGLPIREIAREWNEDPARLHTAYARAREEFKEALRAVVRQHHPEREVSVECARLLEPFA